MNRDVSTFGTCLAVMALVLVTGLVPSGGGIATAHTPVSTPVQNGSDEAQIRRAEDARIVNANPDELPPGCSEIAGNRSVTVRAGRRYAEPGEMFAYDTDVIRVEPCTRLSVTFVNEDEVRHQWMVHGLPREVYPMGMFTIELTGPGKATGTFIVPGANGSLLIHCSLLQHQQKGMHARLVVGNGGTDTATKETATKQRGTGRTTNGQPGFGASMGIAGILVAIITGWRARNHYPGREGESEQSDR